jgi:hypothetical protein
MPVTLVARRRNTAARNISHSPHSEPVGNSVCVMQIS